MSIEHEMIIPKQKPLPKKIADDPLGSPSMSMVVGSTGSGKSVTLMNIIMALDKRHEFDSGLFVTSNNRDALLESVEMPITTSPQELEDWIVSVKQAKQGTKHLLVLDDIQGSKDFNIMAGRSFFTNFLLSHRHYGSDPNKPAEYGVWVLMTAQTLKNSYTPTIRDQIKQWFLFFPRKPTDVKLYEDLAQDPIAMKRAMMLVKNAGKYNFLFLNKHDISEDRYFLNFKDEMKDLK